MKAPMSGEPTVDRQRFVCSVVVRDEMDIEGGGDLLVNKGKEFLELDGAMSSKALFDYLSGLDVEGSEKGGRPVSATVVCATLGNTGTHGEDRLRAIQDLDLGFLVEAQYQGSIRWVHVKPNDVTNLIDEERIPGKLEGLGTMGLQRECSPDSADRRLAQATGSGH